jgi:sulfide:quinone oxidoreductase
MVGTEHKRSSASPQRERSRPRVVIAGGGVASLEALIALRDLLDGLLAIDVVSPEREFVYRPLSVAEPFELCAPRRFSLAEIVADHGAALHAGRVESVDHDRGIVNVRGAPSLSYDALLVTIGAQPREWLPGAVHFAGPKDVARLRALVSDLDKGSVGSVAFAAPRGTSWTLPLYELALLTAAHVAEQERGDVRLTVVTSEADVLDVFGPAAARHVRQLLADRGIELRTATAARSFQSGSLQLDPGGTLEVDRVVALPELVGEPIPGLPHDHAGFTPVDEHGAVRGLPGVYAAGDGIAYPVKQGGLATQQADAAAEAIAASFGAAIEPRPFRARLRGQLLTGLGPTYLTAGGTEAGPRESHVALNPLWWPPSKIAGRYLAPYLSGHGGVGAREQLAERPPVEAVHRAKAGAEHHELRELAVSFAESDAASGDYDSALRWLETVEQLDGLLSPELTNKQTQWRGAR